MSGYAVEAVLLREYYEQAEREMCVTVQVESMVTIIYLAVLWRC
jgi:hypothetical protein|tara:strand:+ start:566 stop:697 length:132 start_codon:yes stop_codon:yes gene_type:complete